MVVTGLGLLLGQRADSGAVRSGAAQASVDGVWIVPEHGAVAERVREAGGDGRAARRRHAPSCSSAARSRARAAAAPPSAVAPRPPACWPISPTSSSSCTASPISCGCAPPPRSATRSTGSAARRCRPRSRRTARRFEHWRAIERELSEPDRRPRCARAEAAAAAASSSPRSSRPRRSRARMPSSTSAPSGSRMPRSCASPPRPRTTRCRAKARRPTPARCSPRRGARSSAADATPPSTELAEQAADLGYRIADLAGVARGLPRRSRRDRSARTRRRRGSPRGARQP